jgi:hypothetical protein
VTGSSPFSPPDPEAGEQQGQRIDTNTWPMWVIALLPLAGLITGVTGFGAPMSEQGTGSSGLRVSVSFIPLIVEVLLAAVDRRILAERGVLAPLHWGWAVLDPVYVIGRSVVVRRRVQGSPAPLGLWLGTSVLVLAVHLLVR